MQQFASAQPNPNPDHKPIGGSSGAFVDLGSINRVLNGIQNQDQEQVIQEVDEDGSEHHEVTSFHDDQQRGQSPTLPEYLRDPNFNKMGNRSLRDPAKSDYSGDDDDG